jgi:hypothetical protein
VDRSDDDALKRAFGHRNQRLAEMKRPLLKRHAALIRNQRRLMENNLSVLDGHASDLATEEQTAAWLDTR